MEPVPVVAGTDARAAAEVAVAHERAAVWVGATGTAAYQEFVAEVARPRPG